MQPATLERRPFFNYETVEKVPFENGVAVAVNELITTRFIYFKTDGYSHELKYHAHRFTYTIGVSFVDAVKAAAERKGFIVERWSEEIPNISAQHTVLMPGEEKLSGVKICLKIKE